MRGRAKYVALIVGSLLVVFSLAVQRTFGQMGAKNGEWQSYGADTGNTHYSPLAQIDGTNFKSLAIAWRFKTDNLGPLPEFNLQSTPLVANGMLYSTGGTRRAVIALKADTGELKWVHAVDEGERGEAAPRKLSGRGLSYWTDGREERILYVTPGYQLAALDAKTGSQIPGFGRGGLVDLKLEDDQPIDLVHGDIGLHSAPVVAKDTVIVGAAHLGGGASKSRQNVKGFVRAYDVRTGKRLWIFHTIPRPGEFGNDTWENDSWSYTGNTGVWAQMSVDEELNMVYLPVETPTGDYYGGHRPGSGLFGESLVAVDLRTGKRIWHFQAVHHGIWDYDFPCAPILLDITVDGRRIKAVAQPSKQSFLYVFNRQTGEPIWPIEERPVPQSDVPGEKTSPTQPFPTKPPAYDRQGIALDDLIDFTPQLRAEAVKIASRYKLGPLFTPPSLYDENGTHGTMIAPSTNGGSNWMGGSADPETGLVYVFSSSQYRVLSMIRGDPKRSDMDYVGGGGGGGAESTSVQGLPLLKPPYGRITAIDLNKGAIAWQIAHGETPDAVRNHPALKGMAIPRTGRVGLIGTLVTKTMLVAGEGGIFTLPDGRRGAMLRAYDKATGKEIGEIYMPAPQSSTPMTYMVHGKQYIVLGVSGGAYTGEFIAFRLPG